LLVLDHVRGLYPLRVRGPGDAEALRASPGWQFGHNWRERGRPAPHFELARSWIPPAASDQVVESVRLLSLTPADANFLRPPKGSPLGTAGVNDAVLPPYVGAVPPEGVEPWDWDWAWDAHVRRLLTVSQMPAGGGRFRTIKAALDKAQPGMTIRILDDAE